MKLALRISVLAAAAFVVSMLIWQGVAAQGAPDPLRPNTSSTVAFLDIGILVFREGLECILVLAAITASMTGPKSHHCPAGHHELVLSQNLLGRLDSRPQSPAQSLARKRAHSGNFAEASLVGLNLARIHLAISGGL